MEKQSGRSTTPGSNYKGVGQSNEEGMREKLSRSAYATQISQTALRSIGMSVRNNPGIPEYAAAVSIIFTEATNQCMIPGTPPENILSTSILCNALHYDRRFEQIQVSEAAPGDIILASKENRADAYAGIVVDQGRIVSNGSKGVQNNSNLAEIKRSNPAAVVFRYMGIPGHGSKAFGNANFNPDESRISSGQPGGGQWTTRGAGMASLSTDATRPTDSLRTARRGPIFPGISDSGKPSNSLWTRALEKGVTKTNLGIQATTMVPSSTELSGVGSQTASGGGVPAASSASTKNSPAPLANKTLVALAVRSPDGSLVVLKTKVKTQEQADQLGVPIGTEIPIFVPPGMDPQAMVNQWQHRKTKTPEDFYQAWKPGGANDYN
jgi:hypothetical protein